jgi:hypothetical protein
VSTREWLDKRLPTVPDVLRRWISFTDEGSPDLVPALTSAGVAALQRAVRLPGRNREAAFHLLAADALITYACEAAADGERVENRLSWILERVAGSTG